MKSYTIDFVFWNPETASVCVKANSAKEAIERALEFDPWSGCGSDDGDFEITRSQETVYDCCTDTAVAGIARGRHDTVFDAPAGAQLAVPEEYQDAIWEPSGVDAVQWRRDRIKRLEREIKDILDDRAKQIIARQQQTEAQA